MESYTLNNISFRITSSTALSQFKAGQAFDFNELIRLNKDYFSRASREALLLNYDLWFRWLLRLEKTFLVKESNVSLLNESDTLIVSLKYQLDEVVEVMKHHPTVFNESIIRLMRIGHKPTNALFIEGVREALLDNIFVAYPKIVNLLSKKLHGLLFELHEFEFAQKPGEEFISFTDTSRVSYTKLGYYPTIERAKFFRDEFNIKDFVIKNYANEDINASVLKLLADNNITVRQTVQIDNRKAAEGHDVEALTTFSE